MNETSRHIARDTGDGGDAMNQFRPTARVRRWLAGLAVLALVGAIGLVPAASVAAAEPDNMVLVWNENAVNVISQPATPPRRPGLGQGPPLAALHVAMVQGAIYDAVNAIDGGHEPYLQGLSAPSTASKAAAVAQAGYGVLIGITPAANTAVRDRIDAMLDGVARADRPEPRPRRTASRSAPRRPRRCSRFEPTTGASTSSRSSPSNEVGKWRLVAPLNANVLGQFATVTPLTLKSPVSSRPKACLPSRARSTPRNSTRSRRWARSRDRAGPRPRR